MIHPGTRKLFDEAVNNHIFTGELLLAGEEAVDPNLKHEGMICTVASVYMGWLIAQNKYDQVDYYG